MNIVELIPLPGNRGYRVTFASNVIVAHTLAPEGDAAVVLDVLGIVGKFTSFVAGKRRMRVADIGEAAECRRSVLAERINTFRRAA